VAAGSRIVRRWPSFGGCSASISACECRASDRTPSSNPEAVVLHVTAFSYCIPKMPAKDVRAYGGTPLVRKCPLVRSRIWLLQYSSATREAASSHRTGATPSAARSRLMRLSTASFTGSSGRVSIGGIRSTTGEFRIGATISSAGAGGSEVTLFPEQARVRLRRTLAAARVSLTAP